MSQSIQAQAVQPNIVQTHEPLFYILVEILKFLKNTNYVRLLICVKQELKNMIEKMVQP